MDNKHLRVLVADDSPDDAELPIRTLREAGYRVKSQRIYNFSGMDSMLQKDTWDIVLSEFTLLQFSAQMALDLLKRRNLDIPLLVVTRSISDRDFASIIAAGARDVVRKNYSTRLVPAIERELEVNQLRRDLHAAQQRVAEMEGQNSAIVSGTQEAVCYCHDGMHIKANQAYFSMFGYTGMDELETVPILNMVEREDQSEFKIYLKKAARKQAPETPMELSALRKDGTPLHVSARFSTVQLNGEDCIQITFDDISQRKATEDRLQFLTQRDPLTGLYNRHFFGRQLTRAWQSNRDKGSSAALVYFDLTQLREINSTYGYTVGDGILLKVSKTFRQRLGEEALLARFGEEEFALLLEGQAADDADALADELQTRARELSFSAGNKKVQCRMVTAVVHFDDSLASAQEAVSRALARCADQRPVPAAPPQAPAAPPPDLAPSVSEPSADAIEWTAPPSSVDLPPATAAATPEDIPAETIVATAPSQPADGDAAIAAALANDGFRLVYQPIVSLAGEADELFEVLVRMVGANGQLIPPGEFLAAAQRSGQIGDIDAWVAQRTIESLTALHGEGRHVVYFINASAGALKQKKLAPLIFESLKQNKLDPRKLVIEFAQEEIGENIADLITFARVMQKIGCPLSIDNAGAVTDILEKIPAGAVRYLKFDGNVVKELMRSGETEALESVLETARKMDIRTVATHIEDAESLSEIWSRGFDYVQGHYFQQPESELSYEFNASDEATLATDELGGPPWSQA